MNFHQKEKYPRVPRKGDLPALKVANLRKNFAFCNKIYQDRNFRKVININKSAET